MKEVKSSNIHAIGWTAEHGLKITFKGKDGKPTGTYHYAEAPESVHDELMAADSHGKHFLAHIRNAYTGVKQ